MEQIGAAWAIFATSAAWRWEQANPKSLPRPGIFVGSATIFSLLVLVSVSERARPVAQLFGWALVVSELIGGNLIPGTQTGQLGPTPLSGGAPGALVKPPPTPPALFGASSGLGVTALPGG